MTKEKGLRLWQTEGGRKKTCKVFASCRSLEEQFQKCSKPEGVGFAGSVETLRVDLRTRTKKLGEQDNARRRKCDVMFSIFWRNRVFSDF